MRGVEDAVTWVAILRSPHTLPTIATKAPCIARLSTHPRVRSVTCCDKGSRSWAPCLLLKRRARVQMLGSRLGESADLWPAAPPSGDALSGTRQPADLVRDLELSSPATRSWEHHASTTLVFSRFNELRYREPGYRVRFTSRASECRGRCPTQRVRDGRAR